MLDYKLIEALAMVIQENGFDKAAQSLHITQSAVSQRVKLLEEQVGQILLARTTPPRATPAGKKFLKHYLQVKRLEHDLGKEIQQPFGQTFTSITVGINADSLATWFMEAICPLLTNESVVLDIRTDDQEETHRMLKNGEVVGCISTRQKPLQGCRSDYLGRMSYGLFAAPAFVDKWFPNGISLAAARQAPAIIFDRKDTLHIKLLQQAFEKAPAVASTPCHYLPSSEKFAEFIAMGLGYGMLPQQQSAPHVRSGRLVDLIPQHRVAVDLYWQCWNLKSVLLEKLTRQLVREANRVLEGCGETDAPISREVSDV